MSDGEGHHVDKKSLRKVQGPGKDFRELAGDVVCFANGVGGVLRLGIEDGEDEPPPDQRIAAALVETVRKRVHELTVNAQAVPEVVKAPSGGEYIALRVARAVGVASTSDGKYFMRVGDTCRPVLGDDVLRLANERPSTPWEVMTGLGIARDRADAEEVASLLGRLRASDRVKESVKEKTDDELLVHYGLVLDGVLTHLGVLLVSHPEDRARLGTAPAVQAIKYDERGTKIAKHVWDDHTLSPVDLVDDVWKTVPDFRESYEIPEGLFRTNIPAYEEEVVRELLVNALVHRPYTQRGDIFLNLRPDQLEVVNVGRLPLGVTPSNILHVTRRRNDGLARVFHDLGLMEREGSGYDLMYDRLLSSGKTVPEVREQGDAVHVVVPRRVLHPKVVRLMDDVDREHRLQQRERIVVGLLAPTEGMSAKELAKRLELDDPSQVASWLSRLLEVGVVEQTGKTRATRYFVAPRLLRGVGLDRKTTLERIEPHRLRALIVEDLARYPGSSSTDIQRRAAPEVPLRTLRRALTELMADGKVGAEGERRWRRYSLAPAIGQSPSGGRKDGR